jgi:hypothetical protein
MADEVLDDVRLDDSPPEAATVPEGDVAETTQDEGGGAGAEDGAQKPEAKHPLEPGGTRWNQMYARTKDAEAKLQSEREQRARLEGELEAMKRQPAEPKTATPPRYTASQLQAMIDEGKATLGQVLAYQEETLKKELTAEVDKKVSETLSTHQRGNTVQSELQEYKTLVPEALQAGTPENQKVLKEFSYLVNMGYDRNDPRTEVLAARAAFGDPTSLKAKRDAKAIPIGRDTMQDTTASGKPKPSEKDPLKDLTSRQRQHYQHMIDRGVYTGWAEVKEELAYVPKRR